MRDVDAPDVAAVDGNAADADPLERRARLRDGHDVSTGGDPEVCPGSLDHATARIDDEEREPDVPWCIVGRAWNQRNGRTCLVPDCFERSRFARTSLRTTPRAASRRENRDEDDGERSAHSESLVSPVEHVVRQKLQRGHQREDEQASHDREVEEAGLRHE